MKNTKYFLSLEPCDRNPPNVSGRCTTLALPVEKTFNSFPLSCGGKFKLSTCAPCPHVPPSPLLLVFVSTSKADLGNPLFLTSLLEQWKHQEARKLSRVSPDIGNITSYSGFFTVDKKCESNLFFWFIPATNRNWKEAPVLFWQQGGPGFTSMFGLFEELGPFQHFKNSGLTKREYSWSMENNLLIIDHPGIGYSFSEKKCYNVDEALNAEEWYSKLFKALVQFYQLFPDLQNNSIILSGESNAGHSIPLYGHAIHKNNPTADVKVNLTGMLILSGWSDAESQIDFGTYYYQLGLIDASQREIYYNYQKQCIKSITVENWDYANNNCTMLTGTLFNAFVGDVNIYNLLYVSYLEQQNWEEFIQSDEVRQQFHVGNLTYGNSDEIFDVLSPNIYKSVKPYVEELLEHYPMVFMNGQFDLMCPYPKTVNFLRSLKWSGNTTYLNANRTQWCYGGEHVGYFKGDDRLYDVLVRGSGHLIPQDKSHLAYHFVNSATSGFPNYPLSALQDCKGV